MAVSQSAPVLESPADVYRKRQLRESSDIAGSLQQLTQVGSASFEPESSVSLMHATQQPVLPLQFFEDLTNGSSADVDNELVQQIATGDVAVSFGGEGRRKGAAYHINAHTGDGEWVDCLITAYDRVTEMYTVVLGDGTTESIARLGVCPEGRDRFAFASQFKAAQDLRKRAEAMIRYNMYVECMPTEECPDMAVDQVHRIAQLATSTFPSDWRVDTNRLMREVEVDYVTCMNKIIFDAYRENLMEDLPEVVMPDMADLVNMKPPPASGVVATPPHNLQEQYNFFVESTSFFTSPFAVNGEFFV
jgi:hypothetical protein